MHFALATHNKKKTTMRAHKSETSFCRQTHNKNIEKMNICLPTHNQNPQEFKNLSNFLSLEPLLSTFRIGSFLYYFV